MLNTIDIQNTFMFGNIIPGKTVVSTCFKFVEENFNVRFTRKSYDNSKLKIYYKVSWMSGQPISVALVIMRKEYWHITHIVTDDRFRFDGYAKRLVKNILKEAKKDKIKYVSCNIRETNESSQTFFTKLGFVEAENKSKIEKKENFLFFKKEL